MTLSVSLKNYERTLGLIYLVAELFLLPEILLLLNVYLQLPLWALNFVLFCINFICVTVIFHRFLIDSFHVALQTPWRSIRYTGLGFLMYHASNILISLLIIMIRPDFSNVNDESVLQMAEGNMALMTIGVVLLVPVTEEVLFRGLIFRGLFDRSKVLAYAVSTLAFAAIHVTGYIGSTDPVTLLLCFVQYIPAGLAFGFAYQKSDTIWAPILMHAAINQIGMSIGG